MRARLIGIGRGTVVLGALAAALVSLAARTASAQVPPPLPPPPPPSMGDPAPAPPPSQPPQQQSPPQYQPQPQYQPPPPVMYAAPPPPVLYEQPERATHAPKYSLWTGGRLGIIGYGGNFYDNGRGQPETTGNFIGNGLALEIDVGVRISRRFIPYIGLEIAGAPAGHRFEGGSAKASSSFLGLGFRYLAGDVNSVAFASDMSFGVRTVSVTNGGDTYQMKSIEIFRLGLGAEIRLSTLFTISPMFTLSGGSMTDTDGTVAYTQNGSGDGLKSPTFTNGAQISAQRGYTVVTLGCGAHFDFFGK